MQTLVLTAWVAVLASTIAAAGNQTVTIARPQSRTAQEFKVGEARRLDGATATLDGRSQNSPPGDLTVIDQVSVTLSPDLAWLAQRTSNGF
jgi:hypothetical protein